MRSVLAGTAQYGVGRMVMLHELGTSAVFTLPAGGYRTKIAKEEWPPDMPGCSC